MIDALAHLSTYPSGKLDPADAEAVESLIAHYLDGQLEPQVAEQVAAVIEADAAVAAIINEAREGKAWIEEVFAPESRRLMQQPASQGTIDLIHDLVAGKEPSSEVSDDEETKVITLPPEGKQERIRLAALADGSVDRRPADRRAAALITS